MDTLNDSLDLDHMNTKVEIIRIEGPCIVDLLIWLVVMLRGWRHEDSSICACIWCDL